MAPGRARTYYEKGGTGRGARGRMGTTKSDEPARRDEADQEDRFRLIVESAPYGILVADSEGSIVMVNRRAEELFGYTREEFAGLGVEDLVPENRRSEHRDMRSGFAAHPELRQMGAGRDLYAVRRDGSEFPVEIGLTPLPEKDRMLFLASVVDITARKKVDEELRQYARELERSNSELESFASVASHDLQEPLRKIRTMGERLETRSGEHLDERGRDYLLRMIRASENMHQLIVDLLAFSRVTTRGEPFRLVDLNRPFGDVLTLLDVAIEESGAVVTARDLPAIEADEVQMRQLFQNLIGNAIKFRRDGVALSISIEGNVRAAGEGEICEVRVRDNGIGFEPCYGERIFQIFQRLHGKGKFEGTGIGLAICKKIVERHGGTIRAEGALGEGAEFIIELPKRAMAPDSRIA